MTHPGPKLSVGRQTCRLLSIVVYLLFSMMLARSADAGQINILTPDNDVVIYARRPVSHLVMKVEEKADLGNIQVRGNGKKYEPVGIRASQQGYIVHYHLELKPGHNSFIIAPLNREIKIKYNPLRSLLAVDFNGPKVYLFHRNQVIPKACRTCHDEKLSREIMEEKTPYGPFSPACYSCHKEMLRESVWHHSPAANVLCKICHQPDPTVEKIIIPSGKISPLCFTCHVNERRWPDMPHVHGPVGTGDCSVCHNPHGDRYPKQLWADGKEELCLACHTDKKQFTKSGTVSYRHGILLGNGCIICHEPHATNHRFQLHRSINNLCISCHPYLNTKQGHPITGHPVQGPKDPRRADRDFSCTSCHNPHGSQYRYMLIDTHLGNRVCRKCHKQA